MARRKRRTGGKMAQRAKFSRAAKSCKGRTRAKFRACMKSKLKK